MKDGQVTLTRWFGWWGWYTDKLETWLETQAAKGWHLVKADRIIMRFHFVKGIPKAVRYCIDYQTTITGEYKTLFQDAGWQLTCESMGWYIWRSEYNGVRPEIFNDVDSLIKRNNRMLELLLIVVLSQIPLAMRIYSGSSTIPFKTLLIVLHTLLLTGVVFATFMTWLHNSKLKARKV